MSEIRLLSAALSSAEMKKWFEKDQSITEAGVRFDLVENRPHLRGVEPTILVAIISAAGTALGALVSGLLQVARDSHSEKVLIQGKDGARVEFPANMSSENARKLVDLLREIESPVVRLS